MRKILLTVMVLLSLSIQAQSDLDDSGRNDKVAFTVTQDGKLAFFKDDHGNNPFTLDGTFKMEWRSYSTRTGYFSLIPNTEYAELHGGAYWSYGVWLGYTFDEWLQLPTFGLLHEDFIDIDIMPYVGLSKIHRKWSDVSTTGWHGYKSSLHMGLEVTFKVYRKVGIVWDFRLIDRRDQKVKYPVESSKGLSPSFAFGVKYEVGI